jgi:hypothetical protein
MYFLKILPMYNNDMLALFQGIIYSKFTLKITSIFFANKNISVATKCNNKGV